MTELSDWIGMAGGTLTTLSFVPQVIKTWKSRRTRDISLSMFLAFTLGVLLWLVYGLMIGAWPVILANLLTLLLAGIILYLKLKHRKNELH
ncbi:MAG: SemiSWEET transporter [Rhodospirillales bacterium]|jgi:MtN3 and saliva related transmembrane protein|nr:SemiSWEET transporter [Rhodospirillales bacterium]MDK9723012.1 SemiSWEET transporter [Rhodospirillales bacterium]